MRPRMRRKMRQRLLVGVELGGVGGFATFMPPPPFWPAGVPSPLPPPLPKKGALPARAPATAQAVPQSPAEAIAAGVKSLFNLDKDTARTPAAVATPGAFTPAQQTQVNKVSSYLSSVQQLVGNFVQVAPGGRRTQGEFYMQKPGRVRFVYEATSALHIVAAC